MHAPFTRIVAENPVDQDFLLVLVEPALFAPEYTSSLRWRCGHPKCGNYPYYSSYQAFERKQVSPAPSAIVAADVEKAEG